jgi:hypothetical protein
VSLQGAEEAVGLSSGSGRGIEAFEYGGEFSEKK